MRTQVRMRESAGTQTRCVLLGTYLRTQGGPLRFDREEEYVVKCLGPALRRDDAGVWRAAAAPPTPSYP